MNGPALVRDPATGARVETEADGGDHIGPRLLIRPVRLPRPRRTELVRRVAQATGATARHLGGLAARAGRDRAVDERQVARAVRAIFDDLGGSFAKFGQLIGSSPSLFGEEVAAEFRDTLDNVAPVPFDEVRHVIEDELGLPLSHLFAELDPEPVAAASLAVVHRAALPDGTPVAVKVLRPDIERAMAVDIAVARPLFSFIGRQVAVGIAGELPQLVSGLEEQLAEELDLRNEARSMRWFDHLRRTLGLERVRVPLAVEGYTTRRVLVMDFVDGVPVDAVDDIIALGVDPAPLVQDCVKAWFASALCTGAFHGDIHAGNLLVTPDGELGVLDWGIVGRLDADTQLFFRRVIEGALGDESAWPEVWKHAKVIYGPTIQEQLGLDDAQMAVLARSQIEPILTRPFGEVQLTELLANPGESDPIRGAGLPTAGQGGGTTRSTFELWRAERRRRREYLDSGVADTDFDRGMFLLGKQLVYFDRYGKLFLPDVPLMWDRTAFERLLAEPLVPAEVSTD